MLFVKEPLIMCIGPEEVRLALINLPRTLDGTYARMLENIPLEHLHYATRILQFLCFSDRPLRINEAVDAIIVKTSSQPRFDSQNRIPIPKEILRYCPSLVILKTQERSLQEAEHEGKTITEIQLAHFSVKEYLISDRLNGDIAEDFKETTARASIAEVCLAYILSLDRKQDLVETRRTYPMAEYSARYWASHAATTEAHSDTVRALAMEFLSCQSSFETCWELYKYNEYDQPPPPALYYASRMGLIRSIRELISRGDDINARGGRYGNALQAASYGGHNEIVHLLLEKEANVNAKGGFYNNSALLAASYRCHEKIVPMLLESGANVNAEGYGYALQAGRETESEYIMVPKLVVTDNLDNPEEQNAGFTILSTVNHFCQEMKLGGQQSREMCLALQRRARSLHGPERWKCVGTAAEKPGQLLGLGLQPEEHRPNITRAR